MAQVSCFGAATNKITSWRRCLHGLASGSMFEVSICYGLANVAQASTLPLNYSVLLIIALNSSIYFIFALW